ncbi:MAG TPA: TonB family protein [Vicinamibacteria bacterium]|nr:TonB family protein [Vicinamibacteria bacterium]
MSWLGRRGALGLSASIVLHASLLGAIVILPVLTPSALPETVTPAVIVSPLAVPRCAPVPPGGPLHRLSRGPRLAAPSEAETRPEAPSPAIMDVGEPPDDAQAPGCIGCSPGGDPAGDPVGLLSATEPAGDGGGPIRVGGLLLPPLKIRHVAPVFPEIAKAARVPGVVVLDCVIGPDGRVTDVHVLHGHPLFERAAVDAVREWLYRPSLLNGRPVAVVMTVTVTFTIPR